MKLKIKCLHPDSKPYRFEVKLGGITIMGSTLKGALRRLKEKITASFDEIIAEITAENQ